MIGFISNSNLDDTSNSETKNKIFERGKVYFVRYEVVTDGSLEDADRGEKYPDCAYNGFEESEIPFYRSNVFGIERQTPTLQRYLWDTITESGSTKQQWKYKLNDPDNAILAYSNFVKDNVKGSLVE